MIGMNDFTRQWADVGQDLHAALERTGRRGWYILGEEVRRFEEGLAGLWGLRHAVGLASGLDAIEAGLRALGCAPGDLVLVSPISAFATVLAILRTGATPVFPECDGNGLADLGHCNEILEAQPSIRFFVPVHLYGHALNLDLLDELRRRHGLSIIEDCAQSIGAKWNGRPCGSAGQAAATSFYPTKNLGAWGDGGALLTNDDSIAGFTRCWRDYGQADKYRHAIAGANSRLDELQAAFLHDAGLPRLPGWTRRRARIAAAYRQSITNPAIAVPPPPAGSESVWHLFPVLVPEGMKPSFRRHLERCGVATAEHYPLALFEQPALQPARFLCPGGGQRAATFCRHEISLPVHPYLTSAEVDRVIAACNSWAAA